ncbi:MAG: MFS transporter, partial [Clostridia bacterium]|nr:MFS transporter [Clostridia bacterium]
MKLDTRRTILVGFAFLSICAFWQLYDNVIPLILKFTFHVQDGPSGIVMSIDNVLALFLLPFFGALSDRTHTRLGRRMPYILCGTAAAVLLMNLLPIADRTGSFVLFIVALGLLLVAMGTYRSPAVALMPDVTAKPLRSKGNAIINLMGTLGGILTLLLTKALVQTYADGRSNYQF